jgi:hypothetical protein
MGTCCTSEKNNTGDTKPKILPPEQLHKLWSNNRHVNKQYLSFGNTNNRSTKMNEQLFNQTKKKKIQQ